MSVEGIFRKNGNIRKLKDTAEAIDRDPEAVDLTIDNPVQLAALLKKFLREMPEPLLMFKLYRLFVASQSKRPRLLHYFSLLTQRLSNQPSLTKRIDYETCILFSFCFRNRIAIRLKFSLYSSNGSLHSRILIRRQAVRWIYRISLLC